MTFSLRVVVQALFLLGLHLHDRVHKVFVGHRRGLSSQRDHTGLEYENISVESSLNMVVQK